LIGYEQFIPTMCALPRGLVVPDFRQRGGGMKPSPLAWSGLLDEMPYFGSPGM
jgi:hypothetical protein